MENIFIHLICPFDANFKIMENKKEVFSLSTTESLSNAIDLSISYPSNFSILVYPQNNKFISYSADFETLGEFSSNSKYVDVYKLPENHYMIKFLPLCLENQEKTLSADRISLKDNKIQKLTILNDTSNRGKVEILEIDGENLVKKQEYYVYMNDSEIKPYNPETLLLSFFEALKVGDSKTIQEMLSQSLLQKSDKETLKTFLVNLTNVF